jgi:hypothetical protein
LVAQISTGTLCTLAHDPEGYPYGSFVTVAFDRGNPIFLITRASERMAAARVPHSSVPIQTPLYCADFRDFAFWKLHVDYVRYIGGYGRMSWISKADWHGAEPDPLGPSAAGMITHMNADHADAMVLYCKAFSKATEVTSASMTGVDRYGFEMSAMTPQGPPRVRLSELAEHTKNLERILARRCSWPRAPLQIRSPTARHDARTVHLRRGSPLETMRRRAAWRRAAAARRLGIRRWAAYRPRRRSWPPS